VRKLRILASATVGAAAIVAMAAASATAAPTARQAPSGIHPNTTIICGDYCADLFNVGDQLSTGPRVTLAVTNGAAPGATQPAGATVRQRSVNVGAYREDFSFDGPFGGPVGTVAQFVRAGWISGTSYAAVNYRNDPAFELEYTPYGASTGECVGVAKEAYSGEHATLEDCGVNANTLWIVDYNNVKTLPTKIGDGVPLINGSNRYATDPEVLTGNGTAAGALTVQREATQRGVVNDVQLWYYRQGPAA
jgi:hypothetical protein